MKTILSSLPPLPWQIIDGGVYSSDGAPIYSSGRPASQVEALTKLIAAAPEMLRCLSGLSDLTRDTFGPSSMHAVEEETHWDNVPEMKSAKDLLKDLEVEEPQ